MQRFPVRITWCFILALGILQAAPAFAQGTEDAIIARVNGEAIMLSQLKEAALDQDVPLSDLTSSGMKGDGYRRAITQLVDEALLLQKAQADEIKVNDMAIASRVDKMIDSLKVQMGAPEKFAQFLKDHHLTIDQLRSLMTEHEQRSTLTTEVVAKRVRLDADTIAHFTQERRGRHEPVEQANLAQILIQCTPDERKTPLGAELRRQALQAAREAGDDLGKFANYARQYGSTDGARAHGGYLGWLDPEALLPPLRDQLRKMQPGDVSPPIETDEGLHVLLLIGRRSTRDLCFAAEFGRERERLLEQLRREATIHLFDVNGKPLGESPTPASDARDGDTNTNATANVNASTTTTATTTTATSATTSAKPHKSLFKRIF